jgi:hypothetical protein
MTLEGKGSINNIAFINQHAGPCHRDSLPGGSLKEVDLKRTSNPTLEEKLKETVFSE